MSVWSLKKATKRFKIYFFLENSWKISRFEIVALKFQICKLYVESFLVKFLTIFNFWMKFYWNSYLLKLRLWNFDHSFNWRKFLSKFRFFVQISIFFFKFRFFIEFLILCWNFQFSDCLSKFRLFLEFSIFCRNFPFLPKFRFFFLRFAGNMKMFWHFNCFGQNRDHFYDH